MRFSKWDFVKDNSLPNPIIIILFTTPEEIMLNIKSTTTKKTTEKKGTFKLSIY